MVSHWCTMEAFTHYTGRSRCGGVVRSNDDGCKFVHPLDSAACVGAFAKGRSSSLHMNQGSFFVLACHQRKIRQTHNHAGLNSSQVERASPKWLIQSLRVARWI